MTTPTNIANLLSEARLSADAAVDAASFGRFVLAYSWMKLADRLLDDAERKARAGYGTGAEEIEETRKEVLRRKERIETIRAEKRPSIRHEL